MTPPSPALNLDLLDWLEGGDLRSDGLSREAAGAVLQEPRLLANLLAGLDAADGVVRGRAADALERVARVRPDLLRADAPRFARALAQVAVPMVRWHAAMTLTDLGVYAEHAGAVTAALQQALGDYSAFVRSWAISGLCVLGRAYPRRRRRMLNLLADLQHEPKHRSPPQNGNRNAAAGRRSAAPAARLGQERPLQPPVRAVRSVRLPYVPYPVRRARRLPLLS